jgi:hypothetical protein
VREYPFESYGVCASAKEVPDEMAEVGDARVSRSRALPSSKLVIVYYSTRSVVFINAAISAHSALIPKEGGKRLYPPIAPPEVTNVSNP